MNVYDNYNIQYLFIYLLTSRTPKKEKYRSRVVGCLDKLYKLIEPGSTLRNSLYSKLWFQTHRA